MLLRIAFKALALFVIFNVLWFIAQPLSLLNRLSVYNGLVPGRARFPFSESPSLAYSLSITPLDQLLASHEIARPKAGDEYRVVMIGDSSIWGYLLDNDHTQAACLNALRVTLPSGKKARFYNLGQPTLSVMKDYLILRHALEYQPDLVIWPLTLASLYPVDQLDFPVIRGNRDEARSIAESRQFNLPRLSQDLAPANWDSKTFWGQRTQILEWLQYQLYGFGWNASRSDQVWPKGAAPHAVNLNADDNLLSVNVVNLQQAKHFTANELSLEVVQAGIADAAAKRIPVLLANEPMYRSDNSVQRYNTYYPRWAYDSYRDVMRAFSTSQAIPYVDFWDAVPADQFTDTDFHLNAVASCEFAKKYVEPTLNLAAANAK